jgi:hypothetical protein
MSYREASELRDGMRIDWDAAGELRAAACHLRQPEGEAGKARGGRAGAEHPSSAYSPNRAIIGAG